MDSERNLIADLIAEGNQFNWSNFCSQDEEYPGQYAGAETPEWLTWKKRSLNAIEKICAEHSPALSLAKSGYSAHTTGYGRDAFARAHSKILKALELTYSALETDVYGELKGPTSTHESSILSNKIFVVHGHDSQLKVDIERFLHEIGLQPVILHREVDEGATIIEKFEKHADVGFAFILLTPDEVAYTRDQESLPQDQRTLERRARPNVIFEFGYFVGRLGRSRVCCLHKGEVAVPSDLEGILYKKVKSSVDEQAYGIIRELKAAGYDIRL